MEFLLKNKNNKSIILKIDKYHEFNTFRKILINKYLNIKEKNNVDINNTENNYKINYNNFTILLDGKIDSIILKKYKNNIVDFFDNLKNENKIINVTIIPKIKGGFIIDLVKCLFAIVKLLIMIPKILIWFASLIVYTFKLMFYLISLLFKVLSKDGITGLIYFITVELCLAPIRVGLMLFKRALNYIGSQIFGIFFGIDNRPPDDKNEHSDHFQGECSGRKCYAAPDGTIPFSVIICTILCPPVGVFMEFGLSGWFQILICSLLTLMFYFPGLIYSLILLYC